MTYWVASEIILAKPDKRLITLIRFLELLEVTIIIFLHFINYYFSI